MWWDDLRAVCHHSFTDKTLIIYLTQSVSLFSVIDFSVSIFLFLFRSEWMWSSGTSMLNEFCIDHMPKWKPHFSLVVYIFCNFKPHYIIICGTEIYSTVRNDEWMNGIVEKYWWNSDETRRKKKAQIKRADTYRFRQRLEIELQYVLNILTYNLHF